MGWNLNHQPPTHEKGSFQKEYVFFSNHHFSGDIWYSLVFVFSFYRVKHLYEVRYELQCGHNWRLRGVGVFIVQNNVRKNASHFVRKNVGSWMIFVDVLGLTFPETSSKRTEDRPPPKGNDRISIVFQASIFSCEMLVVRSVSSRLGIVYKKNSGKFWSGLMSSRGWWILRFEPIINYHRCRCPPWVKLVGFSVFSLRSASWKWGTQGMV